MGVDGAGEHRIAGAFLHRQALAGDRGLVHRTAAQLHHAVEGNALARLHPHHLAHCHNIDRHQPPVTRALLNPRLIGCQLHQPADGGAGAIGGTGLQRLGNRIERHHHGGLGPMADQKGAGDGDRHQGVDVQPPLAQGGEPLDVHRQTGQGDGPERQSDLQALVQPGGRQERVDPFRGRREHQGSDQAGPGHRSGHRRCRLARIQNLGRIPQLLQDGFGPMQGRCIGADGKRARGQLEAQLADAGHSSKRVADLVFLGGAVHRRDAPHLLTSPGRGHGGGTAGRTATAGIMAAATVVSVVVGHGQQAAITGSFNPGVA